MVHKHGNHGTLDSCSFSVDEQKSELSFEIFRNYCKWIKREKKHDGMYIMFRTRTWHLNASKIIHLDRVIEPHTHTTSSFHTAKGFKASGWNTTTWHGPKKSRRFSKGGISPTNLRSFTTLHLHPPPIVAIVADVGKFGETTNLWPEWYLTPKKHSLVKHSVVVVSLDDEPTPLLGKWLEITKQPSF